MFQGHPVRLAEWTEAGVWPRLHEVLLAELRSVNAKVAPAPPVQSAAQHVATGYDDGARDE